MIVGWVFSLDPVIENIFTHTHTEKISLVLKKKNYTLNYIRIKTDTFLCSSVCVPNLKPIHFQTINIFFTLYKWEYE